MCVARSTLHFDLEQRYSVADFVRSHQERLAGRGVLSRDDLGGLGRGVLIVRVHVRLQITHEQCKRQAYIDAGRTKTGRGRGGGLRDETVNERYHVG